MRPLVLKLLTLALCLSPAFAPAQGTVRVFACEPEWGALAEVLAGPRAQVFVATTAQQDPHRIEARPSLIARMRQADLVVCTGAELESGWLPALLDQAANPRVRPGKPGYFEAAEHVIRLDQPAVLDRAQGDIHAAGNPHIQQDPQRLRPVAEALSARFAAIDAAGKAEYATRLAKFLIDWDTRLAGWAVRAAPLKGLPVAVQHEAPYLVEWLGIKVVATLEPKPGVDPSAAHLSQVAALLARTPARAVIRAAYQSSRPADWLSARTGTPQVVLPFTVGGSDAARDLAGLYDDTVSRLLAVAQGR